MTAEIGSISIAYALDLIFGDPRLIPHPVRLLGIAIEQGETFARKIIQSEELAGSLLTLCLVALVYGLSHWTIKIVSYHSPALASLFEILILYFCLSTKDLAVE